MNILLVEDDEGLGQLLETRLTTNHVQIDWAKDGHIGLAQAIETEYDLILWGVTPPLDGVSVCRQLRSQGYQKPILLLTEDDSDTLAIAGFEAGADDYIHKHSPPEALLARIRTWLQRSRARNSAPHPSDPVPTIKPASPALTWGKLGLDPNSGRVNIAGKTISLTATEYNLLELFLRNPDRIFSRSAILDRLWGLDAAPTDRAIVTHVKDIRKKLKAGGLTDDLIETVYGMGYRLKSAPPTPVPALDRAAHRSPPFSEQRATVWDNHRADHQTQLLKRYQEIVHQQVAVLEAARNAGFTQTLDLQLQQAAQQEAHKLAGSLATYGYPQGSKLARSIEHLLGSETLLPPELINQFSERLTTLQQELSTPPIPASTAPLSCSHTYRVLVIDDDQALTEQLTAEADTWGFRIKVAANPTTARSRLAVSTPDVVLLDLSFPGAEEDGLLLLKEIQERSLNLPVIVFSGRDSLADRLAVARLGAQQFLHKPATTAQIFQAINRVIAKPQSSEAKILMVDDDESMLALLSTLLTPWGLEITTLSQPQHFWKTLVATAPDLILLDLEMPQVNGLELCRIVRIDAQWGDLPILVVTAHTDAESLQQAFAAGADDFITKPILGPELVTRVLSRIERNRIRPSSPNRDNPRSNL